MRDETISSTGAKKNSTDKTFWMGDEPKEKEEWIAIAATNNYLYDVRYKRLLN